MIILGIDPGLVQTGYGLIKIAGEKKKYWIMELLLLIQNQLYQID